MNIGASLGNHDLTLVPGWSLVSGVAPSLPPLSLLAMG